MSREINKKQSKTIDSKQSIYRKFRFKQKKTFENSGKQTKCFFVLFFAHQDSVILFLILSFVLFFCENQKTKSNQTNKKHKNKNPFLTTTSLFDRNLNHGKQKKPKQNKQKSHEQM